MAQSEDKIKKAKFEAFRFSVWLYFLHFLAAAIVGVSFFPMVGFLYSVWHASAAWHIAWRLLMFSFCIGVGYFLFGLCLILLCVFTKNLLRLSIKPGLYTFHSKDALSWMGYNTMILIANAAFLDVLRVSPFQILFYRLMGAKVGENVNVNTAGLADLSMLEIGDNVTIGGGVALICHAAERGLIRLESTKIGNNVSIGISSVIMPGCQIGDGAVIAPCSLLPKGSVVPSRAHWGGNPIRDLRAERRAQINNLDQQN